jgi:hypothetical protein
VVSHPNASNSPLNSNTVDFNVVGDSSRKVIYVEEFDVNATLYNTQEYDLVNEDLEIIPDQTGIAATSNWNRIYSIYAPESDVSVKITLEGAAGKTPTTSSPRTPGEGGVSTFNLTLEQGQEYVVNLGAAIWPSGGNSIDTNEGGGGSFFYKGGELLVACGGGSGAGGFDNGVPGSGGGIGVNPTLTPLGFFAGFSDTPNTTGSTGGKVSACTIGDFWQTQGIAPCASIGSTTFFTGKDGQKTSNMNGVTVTRGYKAGLNYQFNAGNSAVTATDGGGGGGALGGNAMRGGTGFDGLGTATGTLGGNTKIVGSIKIEAV